MARPVNAPSCAATHQHRGALWRRMLRINQTNRRKRGQGPITHGYAVVYDYLLWKAPRGLGVLIPTKATIASATGVSLATVKRAIAALSAWGLLLVHPRTLSGMVPSVVAGRIHMRRAEMATSNAYSFPADLPDFGGAQSDPVMNPLSMREGNRRGVDGRWMPAATAAMLARLAEKWGLV
ncbi:hypothetical protein ACFOD4_04705 [Pseudoroseomonas globiformis]|uniref:Helix-turn-helix domain-containing protein n=1 Tax=Teichococcus globiformis TaxID=2307229 RepID=A0ABV7FVF6_9PROT